MLRNNWPIKKLGDIAVINGGGTPPTSNTQYFTGNVPWFTPSEITAGTVSILINSRRQITEEATKYSKIAEQGTVLLSSRATIGNIGIVSDRSAYNQGIKGITPKKELDSWYLSYWLLTNKKELEKSSYGTTFKELSMTALKKFNMVIPPLSVQQKIVDKLNTIRKLQELNQKEIEKAEELFNSSLASFLKSKDDWQNKKLVELLVKSQNSPKLIKSKFLTSGIYPVIDQGQKEIAGFTNEESFVYKGSLPIVVFGDHTLVIKYVDFPFVRGADGTKILTPNTNYVVPKFIYYLLISKKIDSHGYSRHYRYLCSIQFRVPHLKIQRLIVEKLDAIRKMQKLKKLEKEKLSGLFESTLNKLMKPN